MFRQVEDEYKRLVNAGAIREGALIQSRLKWQKSENDLLLARGILKLSTDRQVKAALKFPDNATFYDWVIVSSYYSIFHAAQALLGMKKIKITDRVHHATLISFARHFIINHELEDELFALYEDTESKARELLDIIEEEKAKRGIFQYHRLSRNNLEPAEESLDNAGIFLEAIGKVLAKNRVI
jgi:uncharacterized protein (UPF0332 family)